MSNTQTSAGKQALKVHGRKVSLTEVSSYGLTGGYLYYQRQPAELQGRRAKGWFAARDTIRVAFTCLTIRLYDETELRLYSDNSVRALLKEHLAASRKPFSGLLRKPVRTPEGMLLHWRTYYKWFDGQYSFQASPVADLIQVLNEYFGLTCVIEEFAEADPGF